MYFIGYEPIHNLSIKESNPPETKNIIITAVVSHQENILDGQKNNLDGSVINLLYFKLA